MGDLRGFYPRLPERNFVPKQNRPLFGYLQAELFAGSARLMGFVRKEGLPCRASAWSRPAVNLFVHIQYDDVPQAFSPL